MNRLLPREPFSLEVALDPETARSRLAAALPPAAPAILPDWRVRGLVTPTEARLWYSPYRRANRLAPQLFATWHSVDGTLRLAGEFRQDMTLNRMVAVTVVVVVALLALSWDRPGVPWAYPFVLGALFLVYPRISWLFTGHHIRRIEAFVREKLAA